MNLGWLSSVSGALIGAPTYRNKRLEIDEKEQRVRIVLDFTQGLIIQNFTTLKPLI